MGTSSEGTKIIPDLTFDGTAKHWPVLKQGSSSMLIHKALPTCWKRGKASAQFSRRQARLLQRATKGSVVVAGSGTISLDLGTYDGKVIKDEFNKTSVITSVALAVRGNRKDKLGSNWADPERCGLT